MKRTRTASHFSLKFSSGALAFVMAGATLALIPASAQNSPPESASAKPAENTAPGKNPTLRRRFDYKPIDREYWEKVEKLLAEKKPLEIFELDTPEKGAAREEYRLGIAKALLATDHPLHAQYILGRVASQGVGTRQGFEALRMIHEIAKSHPIDEIYMEEIAFELDTKVDEPESRAMIGYFKARALLKKGYPAWAQQAMGEIETPSTWSEEMQFDRTLQALNAGDSAAAYTRFEEITTNPMARRPTVLASKLALARLVFERKDYKASIATYSSIELPTRERARSLNELAWSYYYERSYGKSLGVIRALKSRYFRPLLSPETLLLEMLIHRELCHYAEVKKAATDFTNHFRAVYKAVEDRQPLENLPQFIQMGLQEGVMQKRAAAIQQARAERRTIVKLPWDNDDEFAEVLRIGGRREKIAEAEITRMIRARADQIANWFLDLREQVWFLEYESSMRMIQLNDDLAERYEPPKADKTRPETIFWPVTDEAWLDELLDYEVLTRDTCKGAAPSLMMPRGRGR